MVDGPVFLGTEPGDQVHGRIVGNERRLWSVRKLWTLAEGLPSETVPLADVADVARDFLCGETPSVEAP